MLTSDKVRGTFIGIALGDALGMPVETFAYKDIQEKYGRVTTLLEPKGHKWFSKEPAGMLTDDTQLSIAVAEGLIEQPLSMDAQVKFHVAALKEKTKGWGKSTKDSIRRLANGVHWSESGQSDEPWTGRGNGVPMKIAPVGLYLSLVIGDDAKVNDVCTFIMELSLMTHRTSISASSAVAQAMAVYACAANKPDTFDQEKFCQLVVKSSELGRQIMPETIGEDDITERLKKLADHEQYDTDRMIAEFGAGSCYCYNSLPFALMHFVKNPFSIDSLYDVVSAGGDTDSNGSMVGALLGALHGESIFPKELVAGIQDVDRVYDVADRFCKALDVK